jgi:hypothetical protein
MRRTAFRCPQIAGETRHPRRRLPKFLRAATGFVHRRLASLGKGGTLDVFLDGPDAKARDAVHVVFANERVRDDNELPAAEVAESEATEGFRLISLAALVRMKLTAFRDKDRVHP